MGTMRITGLLIIITGIGMSLVAFLLSNSARQISIGTSMSTVRGNDTCSVLYVPSTKGKSSIDAMGNAFWDDNMVPRNPPLDPPYKTDVVYSQSDIEDCKKLGGRIVMNHKEVQKPVLLELSTVLILTTIIVMAGLVTFVVSFAKPGN